MFGFDGDYRRRPVQSLGGASQSSDRETIIRKAQHERQKRNEMRLQNNGAVVLQSHTRSFIHRQRRKRLERELFDDFLRTHRERVVDDDCLSYLLRRLLFFYTSRETKDGKRLIDVCQHILRQPERLLRNSSTEFIWLHRLKKLLDICMTQMTLPNTSPAIPLRILEVFTSTAVLDRYMEDEDRVHAYLLVIFSFLVKHEYFVRLRELLETKCPPLDGETLHAPSPFADAIFQLMLRPLLLKNKIPVIYEEFSKHILAKPFSDPIRNYVLPSMAECSDFPFYQLIQMLQHLICSQKSEEMQVDITSATTSSPSTITGASSLPHRATAQSTLTGENLDTQHSELFSSYLFNAILILDRKHIGYLHKQNLVGDYIKIIAEISSKILQLPKSTLKLSVVHHQRTDAEESSDDEEEEEKSRQAQTQKKSTDLDVGPPILSSEEQVVLLECITLLNDSQRVRVLVEQTDTYLIDTKALYALCKICHNLMIYNKQAIFEYKLLYTLAFMPNIVRTVWFTLTTQSTQLGFNAPLSLISKGVVPQQRGVEQTIPLLATFCMLFGRLLPTLHDAEFCDEKDLLAKSLQSTLVTTKHVRLMPFSIAEIVQLSKTLKEISLGLVDLAFPETRSNLNEHYRFVLGRSESDDKKMWQQKQIWANLLKVVVFVLNQIHTRDLRLGFCPESHWTVSRLDLPLDRPTDLPLTRGSRFRGIRPFQPIRDFTREDFENGPPMSTKQIRSITILREIPFVVSFSKRVGILQGLVAADKMRVQGNYQAFLQGPSIILKVRRSHLYEDAYDRLRPENEPDLRLKFRVQFISSLGLEEAGIDGGGVFREFLSELIKTAFDPNRGFFMVTTDNKLYPNPDVADLEPDFERHYYFIGRILGKAIYENLLVELPLAEFFLTKLAGKYADVDIHQLASLDPELYKNLLYLKDYEGDVSELNLDFTVASNSLGHTHMIELKPNGQSIPVSASNRIEYLQLMANYKLNVQIRKHCVAFRRGLSNVLPIEWLYMFSNKELQILISGAEIPIDLEDLKRHCKYGGEYSPEHPSIIVFWSVLESFNDLQRRQLLKFVTSCSRPPLLGFKDLDPPFFIQNAGDMERLPTASTCTNLLKLPPFKTEEQMREKLLYAIQSGVGFELS
ncbi:PREDICTED: ubiquitin-protein ligase E3C [Rhagoletis zephyria]|uniref:ubiquitin-protein ligase E3C n=1 Tax=Rhagoletis zephyria TaxID=28612 RepID=UPI00081173C2|nr:PREDICTED: ubiquitin-protein ligase E3C [Rhagoletis zephyria]XP_017478557.1 PREDICTED: ubiquitin-protein ligase E3C [Rhagoletis zephyria]